MDSPVPQFVAPTVEATGGVQAGQKSWPADVLSLYQRLLPAEFFAELQRKGNRRQSNRVYTDAVVLWLMIVQRLRGSGTMESAVLELVCGLPASFWPKPCKRLSADGPKPALSSNTGSYNNARQALAETMVEQCFDRVFEQLIEQTESPVTTMRRAFFLDGTSLRMAHSETLRQMYPPASNQHGGTHWPILRMLVAHDLYSGLAMRPQWGPMYGGQAVSEQGLLEKAIDRLPGGSVVVGDSNFGVFSVAYAAAQRGHPVVLRLTAVRAQHLAGGPLEDGIDRTIQWTPTNDDRRNHPELPADACVVGRLLVRQVQPSNGTAAFLLALFTTMEGEPEKIFELYGKRWNIETDLRSLKVTMGLGQLTCTTPTMVNKEIDVAMMAYNLVRAVTYLAARKADLPPRAFGFTRVRKVIDAFGPLIAAASDERQAQKLLDKMMYYVGQAKLPKRNGKRPSYPRAVWVRPRQYPTRKE